MGKYRTLGVDLDRQYRNDLNANFTDVDTDMQAQKKRVDDLIVGTPQPSEVVDARGGFTVLSDRLNGTDTSLNGRSINVLFPPVPMVAVKGDGVTDDASAIQSIINNCSANGGGEVFFPLKSSKYKHGTSISVPENVTLTGKGHGLNTAVLNFTGTGYAIKSTGQHTRINIENIRVELNGSNDGILIGDLYANLNGYVPGINRMENVTVAGLGAGHYGIRLLNVSHASLDNIHVGYGNTTGGIGLKIESDTLNTGVIVANNCVFGRVDATDIGMIIDGNSALDSFAFNACYFGGKTATVQLGQSSSGVVRNAVFNGCHYECRNSTGNSFEVYNVRGGGIFGGSFQGYGTLKNAINFMLNTTTRRFNVFGVEANSVLTNFFNNEGASLLEDCILQACVKTGTAVTNQFSGYFGGCQRFDETKFRLDSIVPENIYLGGTRNTYGTAMPTTGTYNQGDYVKNTRPSILGSAGSKYTVNGWNRITTGSSHVLNTDWVEDRALTGQ